jgi:hypothetical protein
MADWWPPTALGRKRKIEEKTGVPAFRQTTPGFFLDPG